MNHPRTRREEPATAKPRSCGDRCDGIALRVGILIRGLQLMTPGAGGHVAIGARHHATTCLEQRTIEFAPTCEATLRATRSCDDAE